MKGRVFIYCTNRGDRTDKKQSFSDKVTAVENLLAADKKS